MAYCLTFEEIAMLTNQYARQLELLAEQCDALDKENDSLWEAGGYATHEIVSLLTPRYTEIEDVTDDIQADMSTLTGRSFPTELRVGPGCLAHYAAIDASTGIITFYTIGGTAVAANDNGSAANLIDDGDEIEIVDAEDEANKGYYLIHASSTTTSAIYINSGYTANMVTNAKDTKLKIVQRLDS